MRHTTAPECVAAGFEHAEAPTAIGDRVWFSDVEAGGVYSFDDEHGVTIQIPHRRGVGGICPHAEGGVVVTGRNVSWKRGDDTVVLMTGDEAETFSDLCADRLGRLYVGGLYFDRSGDGTVLKPGRLHEISIQGESTVVGEVTDLPNGVAFSPDHRWLYHSDTTAGMVWRYAHRDGAIGDRQKWLDLDTRWPDGLAVGEDGSVWVALARAGAVGGWTESGTAIGEIRMESDMVTSVCFAGPGLSSLYVTTAAAPGAPGSGGLFRVDVGVRGNAVDAAAVVPAAAHD